MNKAINDISGTMSDIRPEVRSSFKNKLEMSAIWYILFTPTLNCGCRTIARLGRSTYVNQIRLKNRQGIFGIFLDIDQSNYVQKFFRWGGNIHSCPALVISKPSHLKNFHTKLIDIHIHRNRKFFQFFFRPVSCFLFSCFVLFVRALSIPPKPVWVWIPLWKTICTFHQNKHLAMC